MLRNTQELGLELRGKFESIEFWPELMFNQEDKQRLQTLNNVQEVNDHSIQISGDSNHCIIPSQVILYAVTIKEYALALRAHMDVFDSFKSGKSSSQIGTSLTNQTFDLTSQNLDSYSESIALRPLIDSTHNYDAKSILNGTANNYKIRGSADFFTSVILKIINIPDASSGIIGKLIYQLSGNLDLYNYLEKRFLNYLPYIVKASTTNNFVLKSIEFLIQYDGLEKIQSYLENNSDPSNLSFKLDDIKLTSVFKIGDDLLNDSDLSQAGKLRFFNSPIFQTTENKFLYVSKEWTNGTDSRLDLVNFVKAMAKLYPEFKIEEDQTDIILLPNSEIRQISLAPQIPFSINSFVAILEESGLLFSQRTISRLVSSLVTKPFVILSGLSGSGKTKLAQAFTKWICQDDSQVCIVPVGADWTNREPLLGYPNALQPDNYVKPENGTLDLIIQANQRPDLPHFLILDEMNLSHVERYFADFLSVMESGEEIPLFSKDNIIENIPSNVSLPSNLFIIGTVNIDETTYMFSPKVLDRANAIEFRVSKEEITHFFENKKEVDMSVLNTKGASMAKSFLKIAENKLFAEQDMSNVNETLVNFFGQLKKTGAEFGYRSASEIIRLFNQLTIVDSDLEENEKIDIAIMQKLLPKLHGSRRKLCPMLLTLAGFCTTSQINTIEKEVFEIDEFDFSSTEKVKYPLSLEKITRMYNGAIDNGFASYAEA